MILGIRYCVPVLERVGKIRKYFEKKSVRIFSRSLLNNIGQPGVHPWKDFGKILKKRKWKEKKNTSIVGSPPRQHL